MALAGTALAAIRPDDWNIPLFLHVLGAMALVGALVLAIAALAGKNTRLGFRALLWVALPSWVVMRVAAQWILSEEGLDDADSAPAWVDIGFMTSESSFLLLLIATVFAGVSARKGRTGGLVTAATVLVSISLAAYVVAVWAMTAKPS